MLKVFSIKWFLDNIIYKVITEMPILITYLLMDMKGVSLDNNYIVDFGILYFD